MFLLKVVLGVGYYDYKVFWFFYENFVLIFCENGFWCVDVKYFVVEDRLLYWLFCMGIVFVFYFSFGYYFCFFDFVVIGLVFFW